MPPILPLPITDPVLIVALAMGLILLAPMLFRRLRLPGIVGLIVAGALVGPSVLGLLERDATFELLGTVGLLYLMFVAGVTLDLNQFARQRTQSLVFGLVSFGTPMGLSLLVGPALLGLDLPTSFLLGSIVGSHTLLALPVAQRLGIAKNPAVIMATGGTMVTDVLSLVVLAVVVALQTGDANMLFWGGFAARVALWLVAVLVVLPRLGQWFFRTVRKQPDVEFVFLMFAFFATAWLADLAGLAAIIGAFAAGLVLNRLVPPQSPLMTRIRFVGNAVFIPFFLLSVGLLVDVSVLTQLDVWAKALVVASLVFVGKTIAAGGIGLGFRLRREEIATIAGLTFPQAAATLAVTLIGFDLGFFEAAMVNAVVVVILMTCLAGPWLVERFGRAVALAEAEAASPTERPQRILVPLANPDTAEELVDLALLLHSPTSRQPIYPLTIARREDDVPASEKLLETAVVHAAAADVPCTPLTRIDLNPASGIIRAVREERISTVVVGWNGRSTATAFVFGSILDQVLEETRTMTVVSKLEAPVNTTARLLVAVPPLAEREAGFPVALRALKVLADQKGASLLFLTTSESVAPLRSLAERTKPAAPFEVATLDAWADLPASLDRVVVANDMIVLVSVRQGTLAWRPALDRLPRVLAARFDTVSFLTIYLAEPDRTALTTDANDPEGVTAVLDALPPQHILTALRPGSAEYALQQLLCQAFADRPELPFRLARILAQGTTDGMLPSEADPMADGTYAPELLPGVVFYHLHTPEVRQMQLFLGLNNNGLLFEHTGSPVHAVLVLLVPMDVDSTTYLRRLSVVAHLIHTPEHVEAVRDVNTPAEARALLRQHLAEAVVG
ncbi:MAG: cation:proton antiporter [Bacteroidota bacterium]